VGTLVAAPAVVVQDVTITGPGQAPIQAYVVRPQTGGYRPRSMAGVLYLHWFEVGHTTQDRGEFLAEAVTLAGRGVVAMLPQLTFPWAGDPVGDARDRASVAAQYAAVRRAYHSLVAQPGVDQDRTAVVGHDYGGMYAALLAQAEPRLRAGAFLAVDATWANWFGTFWLGLSEDAWPAYRALFAGLDPVENCGRLGTHAFLQWGDQDRFVPEATRDRFAAACPAARSTVYTRAGHSLTQQAKDERMAWLSGELGLA